jgi:hypothetical protein
MRAKGPEGVGGVGDCGRGGRRSFLEVRDEGLTVGADEEPTSSDGDPGQLALQVLQAQAESKHFRSVAACGGASRRQEYFFVRKVRAGIPMVVPLSFSSGARVQNGCAATGEGPLHRSVGPQLQIRLLPPSDRGLSCRMFLLWWIVRTLGRNRSTLEDGAGGCRLY